MVFTSMSTNKQALLRESGEGCRMTNYVAAALEGAGFCPPSCMVEAEWVKERRLPMWRLERQTRVKVRWYPEPTKQTLSFHPEEEEPLDYRLSEIIRRLELIDTPDGLVRGRAIEGTIKDGAAVVKAAYTEILHESPPRTFDMRRMELTFNFNNDRKGRQ
jgi:hypothetical protein